MERDTDQSDVRIGQWRAGTVDIGSVTQETDRQTGSILVLPAEGDLSTSGQSGGHDLENIQALIQGLQVHNNTVQ